METLQPINQKGIKVLLLTALFFGLLLSTRISDAQSQPTQPSGFESTQVITTNSRPKHPKYIGYELGIGVPSLAFKSSIKNINDLKVSFLGVKIGGVISNAKGKVKAYAGLYYPDAHATQDFDLLEGGVSTSVYLLRLKQTTYHSFEPYLTTSFNYQVVKYYGTYLESANANSPKGYDQPLLGNTTSAQFKLGTGVEFQLESETNKFVHLFVEGGVGVPVSISYSNKAFSQTKTINQVWFTVGVNFGSIK